jgi:sugar phosphate isomerase/epimerase
VRIGYQIFLFLIGANVLFAQNKLPDIGIVSNFENDSVLHANGYNYLVESISKCISPRTVSAVQFQSNLMAFKKMKTKLYALNIFLPGDLKIVGPEVKEEMILSYAEEVIQRCRAANVNLIIWGSGGARRIPEGFDRAKAKEQFISIAKRISELAKKYHIVLALENLNSTETNFITTLDEALKVVREVNHPNFRLCADIYHMLKEGEGPEVITKTKKYVVHCDLAEKDGRTPPGTKNDDFMPYLKALKSIHYTGKIIMECRWDNLAVQANPAYVFLRSQIDIAYHVK